MDTKQSIISIPLATMKPLYRNDEAQTLVVEVPLKSLREANDPETLDEIIAQARLDYATGDYQSFSDVDALVADLRS